MRIALVHNFFYHASGATELVFNAARELTGRGHSVDVFALNSEQSIIDRFMAEGIDFSSLGFREFRCNNIPGLSFFDPVFLGLNKVRAFLVFRGLSRRLNEDFDVVLTSHYHLTPITHPLLRGPVAYYCHEPPRQYYEPVYGRGNAFRGLTWRILHPFHAIYEFIDKGLDKFLVKKADKVISNSDYTSSVVKRIYGRDAVTVYPGLDVERFTATGEKRDILLSVGRMYHDLKGHKFILRSLSKLEGEAPKLVIVGDGTDKEKKRLRDIANEHDLQLEIRGGLSSSELIGLYSRAVAVLFGYVREPFGITVLDALACVCPVVAVAEGGLMETVSEDVGFLVPRDEAEFARAVELILDNPSKAREMGKKGRQRVVEHFTWDRFGVELERVLSGLSSSSK